MDVRLVYENAIPAAINSAKPTAGTTHTFFFTNSAIYFLQDFVLLE